jgi:polysaccharide export outer membrane protein
MNRAVRSLTLACALALVGASSGCVSMGKEEAPVGAKPNYRYRLDANDLVRVSVWGRPELLTETNVAPDGRIALPLAGVVPVATLTLEEAAERIAAQLKEFVRDPIVTIELREVKSAQIHVVGEVRVPGSVPYHNGITFLEAIQKSGSYVAEFANVDSFLLIRDPLGAKQIYVYDMEDMLTDPTGQKDVFLQPGDVVYVPPRYVTQFSRWIRQALAPIESLSGVARTGAFIAVTPRPF